MNEEIGKRVAEIRSNMGMTKVEFAELIGITNQYLGRVERGENGLTIEKAVNIGEKTGVSLDYLLTGKQSSEEEKAQILSITQSMLSEVSINEIRILCEMLNNMAAFLRNGDVNELLLKAIFESRN